MNIHKSGQYARGMVIGPALLLALLLAGCGTKVQTLSYDGPVQENQSSVLIIPNGYTVTRFDGQHVAWKASSEGLTLSERAAAIRLPSGRHRIAYTYYWHEPGQTTYEHYASGAVVQRTTPARTTSFEGNILITMDPGNRYRFQGRSIVPDTYTQYDHLP